MRNEMKPTVREINRHLSSGSNYCYVRIEGETIRIIRARLQNRVMKGKVLTSTIPVKDWIIIPDTATIELC